MTETSKAQISHRAELHAILVDIAGAVQLAARKAHDTIADEVGYRLFRDELRHLESSLKSVTRYGLMVRESDYDTSRAQALRKIDRPEPLPPDHVCTCGLCQAKGDPEVQESTAGA